MKILQFFNNDVPQPKSGEWQDLDGFESTKLAWASADSWRKHGWEVERVLCPPGNNMWAGRLFRSAYRYNDFLPRLLTYMITYEIDRLWVTTYDVFNFGFLACDPYHPFFIPSEQFTLATFFINQKCLNKCVQILKQYDANQLPQIACELNHDEGVLREHLSPYNYELSPIMKNAVELRKMPLVHYGRSSCLRFDSANPPKIYL